MIKLFLRLFSVKNEELLEHRNRKICGIVCSLTGIFLNFLLFLVKLIAGRLSGSVAVTVDAVHNLTDCASSVVALLSFLLSGSTKIKKFPMGAGRAEYIAGFLISIALIVTGFELAGASVEKIITPGVVSASALTVTMLVFSVFVKLYMAWYGFYYGKKISSAPLRASATDCLCDSIATLTAVVAVVISDISGLNADAWGGLAVSLFIVIAAFRQAWETASLLMGKSYDDIVEGVLCVAFSHKEVVGVRRVFVDDYGPENLLVRMQLCVDADMSLSGADKIRESICSEIENSRGLRAMIEIKPLL